MHIHLDPVGGIAGDMFIAALLDAFPGLAAGLDATLGKVGLPPGARYAVLAHHDGVLSGRRFELSLPAASVAPHGHAHVGLAAIRAAIAGMGLEAAVAARAEAIFTVLAEAEAAVHGVSVDEVEFHEVGALDSIADIIGAAWLIEALAPATWSVGALPLGSGRVQTAHGALPVPAPAVVELLQGFAFFDDGLPGERVTPTGAAILRHLGCASGAAGQRGGRLAASGLGFGTRKLPGVANALRVLAFETMDAEDADEVALLAFEVDDQTAEDLAIGLERLRASDGVLDVVQSPVFGKKGRMAAQVQVLAEPQRLAATIAACFAETTTLGVRHQLVARSVLARSETTVAAAGARVRVKIARRPGGALSAKAESDDVRAAGSRGEREKLRRETEAAALSRKTRHAK